MWDVANFRISEHSGLAASFGFELQVHDSRTGAARVVHGDGLLLTDGRVWFNRVELLGQVAREQAIEPRQFLEALAQDVRARARQLAPAAA